MPNKSVSNYEHSVLFAKLDKAIGGSKVVSTWLGVDQPPFQNVLRSDGVEVSGHDFHPASIFSEDLAPIERGTDQKVVLEDVFKRSLWRCCPRNTETKHAQSG